MQCTALRDSKWVYVGNIAFHTSESMLQSLFSTVGPVHRVILGLNRVTKKPCGFGFVEYRNPSSALEAVSVISGTVLDGRQIRVELDFGFKDGRQYGRGQTGGQVSFCFSSFSFSHLVQHNCVRRPPLLATTLFKVRDDRRESFDPGRFWSCLLYTSPSPRD